MYIATFVAMLKGVLLLHSSSALCLFAGLKEGSNDGDGDEEEAEAEESIAVAVVVVKDSNEDDGCNVTFAGWPILLLALPTNS